MVSCRVRVSVSTSLLWPIRSGEVGNLFGLPK